MDAHRFIHKIVRGKQPLTPEQIADWWAAKNLGAIAEITMRSMLDPAGTAYDLPPLRIVGFESPDARILYQLRLHKAARAQRRAPVVRHALGQHLEEMVFFAREQFLRRLKGMTITETFQTDQFAVREKQ